MVMTTKGKLNQLYADGKATSNVEQDLDKSENEKNSARISYKASKANYLKAKSELRELQGASSKNFSFATSYKEI